MNSKKTRQRAAALLCAVTMLLTSTTAYAVYDPYEDDGETQQVADRLNSLQYNGRVRVSDLREVAKDYDGKVSQDFLDEVDGWSTITVSELKSYAVEYQLPAQYLQRFIDDAFVIKAGNTYKYTPVDFSLDLHSYEWDNLHHYQDGEKQYIVDGENRGIKVIDVSGHQGDIDWEAVKADGVNYAFIRVGYRGYTKGNINVDGKFHQNIQNALDAGVKVGVYFYSQAINEREAIDEAKFVLNEIDGYHLDLPVVFDIEGPQNWTYRTYGLSARTFTNISKAFLDTIKSAGYETMLYSYSKFFAEDLELSRLQDYDLWMAQYYHEPFFPYNFKIWQYDYTGKVDGIQGGVDMNILFLDYEAN